MHNTGKKRILITFIVLFLWFNNICYFNFTECILTKKICQYIQNNIVLPVSLWYLVSKLSAL